MRSGSSRYTVHPLWVSVSTEHQCYTHRVRLASSSCGPALCGSEHGPPVKLRTSIWHAVLETGLCEDVSDFLLFVQPESHFMFLPGALNRAGSAARIPTLFLPDPVRLESKMLRAVIVSESAPLHQTHVFFSCSEECSQVPVFMYLQWNDICKTSQASVLCTVALVHVRVWKGSCLGWKYLVLFTNTARKYKDVLLKISSWVSSSNGGHWLDVLLAQSKSSAGVKWQPVSGWILRTSGNVLYEKD